MGSLCIEIMRCIYNLQLFVMRYKDYTKTPIFHSNLVCLSLHTFAQEAILLDAIQPISDWVDYSSNTLEPRTQ